MVERKNPNESIDSLIRRFNREVELSGIKKEIREKEYFYPPSALRHQKNQEWKRKKKYRKVISKWKSYKRRIPKGEGGVRSHDFQDLRGAR